MNHINPISKLLQSKDFDLSQTTDLFNNSLTFFKELTSYESFNNVILEAEKLVNEIDIEKNLNSLLHVIVFYLKIEILSRESVDDTIQDSKEKYKYNLFLYYRSGNQCSGTDSTY